MIFKLLRCILQFTWSQFDTSLHNLLGMVLVMIQCMLMLTWFRVKINKTQSNCICCISTLCKPAMTLLGLVWNWKNLAGNFIWTTVITFLLLLQFTEIYSPHYCHNICNIRVYCWYRLILLLLLLSVMKPDLHMRENLSLYNGG